VKKTTSAPKRKYTRKNTTKKSASSGKRRSNNNNFLQAFKLAAVLTIISIFISITVILIHSNLNNHTGANIAEDSFIEPIEPDTQIQDYVSNSISPPPVQTLPKENNNSASENGGVAVKPADNNAVKTNDTRPSTAAQPSTTPSTTASPAATVPVKNITVSAQKPVESLGTLVFVIDDAGNNLRELEPFLHISSPLTVAVLPGLPNSAEAARRIRAAGKEVILHQPMEAIGGQNPGPGAVYSGMSASEIRSILKRNIEEIGPVAGMNNHQGSKITEDSYAMEVILAFCKENGIYFLDSRTTAETVVPQMSARMGIKIGQRDIFIDNEQDKVSMSGYIKTGLDKARQNGSAVMIGHAWSPELAPLLAEQLAIFSKQGYSIKTASDIIK